MSENVSFQPNPEQVKFLELYLDFNKKTNKEIADDIGISDRTIYRWFNEDGFVEWVNSYKTKLLSRSLTERMKVAIKQSLKGDFQFSKMLFEMTGDYTQKLNLNDDRPKRIEVEIVNGNSKNTGNEDI